MADESKSTASAEEIVKAVREEMREEREEARRELQERYITRRPKTVKIARYFEDAPDPSEVRRRRKEGEGDDDDDE